MVTVLNERLIFELIPISKLWHSIPYKTERLHLSQKHKKKSKELVGLKVVGGQHKPNPNA